MSGVMLWGWDGTQWVKVLVNAAGKLIIDPSDILEDVPTDGEVGKAPTSNWAHDEAVARAAADLLRLLLTGGTMSGAIAMGTNLITGLGAPASAGDALRKGDALTITEMAALTTGKIWQGVANRPSEVAMPSGVPSGVICMWHGLISNIPSGWVICDGNNGTPNLLGRFVEGVATAATNPGTTGGQTAKTTAGHTHNLSYPSSNIQDFSDMASQAAYHIKQHTQTGVYTDKGLRIATSSRTDSIADIRPLYYDIAFIMKT